MTLGRLTFTRTEAAFGDGPAGWALQVHVPPTGRLNAAEIDASIDRALPFFARHYPDEPIGALICVSWLLDPQLAEYLAGDSAILAFQSRFHLLPYLPFRDDSEGDRELMRLGLGLEVPESGPLSEADLARVPTETTLQRAFTAHIRSGRHWRKRTGIRLVGDGRS